MRIAPRRPTPSGPNDPTGSLHVVETHPDQASTETEADAVRAVRDTASLRSNVPVLTRRRMAPSGTDQPWCIDVSGREEAIPLVRRWVRLLLAEEPELAEAFELIVSEYGTNALWHSASGAPGGRIRVELLISNRQALLTVLDDGPVPVRTDEEADPAEHGRGLILADAYADETGQDDRADGHAAWALINH